MLCAAFIRKSNHPWHSNRTFYVLCLITTWLASSLMTQITHSLSACYSWHPKLYFKTHQTHNARHPKQRGHIMVVPRSRGWHYLCLLSVGTGVALQADPGLAEPCAVWALEVRICRWDTGCQVAAFSGGLCLMATLFLKVGYNSQRGHKGGYNSQRVHSHTDIHKHLFFVVFLNIPATCYTLVYLRDRAAQTSLRAATLR